MPWIRQSPCLRVSRTRLCPKPALEFVRWRTGGARAKKKIAKYLEWRNTPSSGFGRRDSGSHAEKNHIRRDHKSAEQERATKGTTIPHGREGSILTDEKLHDRNVKQTRLLSSLIKGKAVAVIEEEFTTSKAASLWGVTSKDKLYELTEKFKELLKRECLLAEEDRRSVPPLFGKLRKAFIAADEKGLREALKLAISNFLLSQHLSNDEAKMHQELSDMTHPAEWYPATRAMQRKIILHVGPTNSGKTYHALKRLEEAKSGIFAGPLRLLAHEVYTRFNAKNVPCALVTGEERRLPQGFDNDSEDIRMRSCTVEMVPLNMKVDVCVIDEIQMIGDDQRGWAWTQAFLGVQAREIHLCGEERTVPLIKDLCALIGDTVEVNRYERLSPLQPMERSLNGKLQNLEKGDCVILFSRLSIHQMKRDIEKATGKLCAVVYGSLPPETRAQQAALFNDPNNDYDYLAASDAIGMGLNLSIKRVVFESIHKHNGIELVGLTVPQIKQIGGRAGRYRTAAQAVESDVPQTQVLGPDFRKPKPESESVGLVTSLFKQDISQIRSSLSQDPGPVASGGLLPSEPIVHKFASYFPPKTPFSYILCRLHEIAKLHPRFHLCTLKDQLTTSDTIQDFDLTVPERLIFCAAPAMHRMRGITDVVRALAKCVSKQSGGGILDISAINLDLLDAPEQLNNKDYLVKLESLHNSVNLYLWVSYRFAGVFTSNVLAFHIKSLVEDKINKCLSAGERKIDWEAQRERELKKLGKSKKKWISEAAIAGFDESSGKTLDVSTA